MLRCLLVILVASIVSNADAAVPQPTAIPKNGSCPSNYGSDGKYCVPSGTAKFAIPRVGSCPSNYSSDGNYCVASGMAKFAIVKTSGSCPSNYSSDGNYCVSSK